MSRRRNMLDAGEYVRVELEPGELFAARCHAAGHALTNHVDYKHVGGQNMFADLVAGATVEFAFAKVRDIWPRLVLRGDGGRDFTMRDGTSVDCKAVHRRGHRLALPLTTRPRADVFVVGVVWPLHVVEFAGWFWQDEALVEGRRGRISERPEHPESYLVEAWELHPMGEAPVREVAS